MVARYIFLTDLLIFLKQNVQKNSPAKGLRGQWPMQRLACDIIDTFINTGSTLLEGNLTIKRVRMVLTCCIVGCHKQGSRDEVSFFRIPSTTGPNDDAAAAELILQWRQAWISKIKGLDSI